MTVPLVLVTGFLGAGKTTLVNRLLARRAAAPAGALRGKLGVIVNELGAVGIDGALLAGDDTRQIELPGGCVCCVLGDELGATLVDLCARTPELTAIVLETTGVAEPLPIAWAIERPPVAGQVRLAAVVTVVDAAQFLASRAVSASVDAQVTYADVVLVTKAELAGDQLAAVTAAIAGLAPRALVHVAPTDDHAAWLEGLLADPALPAAQPARHPAQPVAHAAAHADHVHTDDCRHPDSPAAHGIDSVWVAAPEPVDLEELCDQLAELPSNYVRIKGILRVTGDGGPRWVAVHRVGPRVSYEPVLGPGLPEGRLVALGPAVAAPALAACVAAAIA